MFKFCVGCSGTTTGTQVSLKRKMDQAMSPLSASQPASTVQSPDPNQQQQQPQEMETTQQILGVKYVCGDCGHQNLLGPNDPVRCTVCGYRILYKMRTKRLIQFEAR